MHSVTGVCWNAVVRSTDSETLFDDTPDRREHSPKRWRKRRSMYRATDSADSMSEPEEVSSLSVRLCVCRVMQPAPVPHLRSFFVVLSQHKLRSRPV